MLRNQHGDDSLTTTTAPGRLAFHADYPPHYAASVRFMHWCIAVLMLLQIAIGVLVINLPRTPLRAGVMDFHKSLGVTLLALVVARVLIRLAAGAPSYAPPLDLLTKYASKAGHLALYGFMFAVPITGYVHSAAGGHSFNWFGLFRFPEVVGRDEQIDHSFGYAHDVLAWAILALIAGHVAAALWHAVVKKDNVLQRMWPRNSGS